MQKIAAGKNHIAIVNGDGYLWTCGDNSYGQLGFLAFSPKQSTIKRVKKLGEVQAVAAGERFTAVIDNEHSAWMFGDNREGQLGLDNKNSRVIVPGKVKIPTTIRSVACGYSHTLFLDENGDVWSTGVNRQGQLGCGDDLSRRKPEKIEGLPPIQSVSCGSYHSTFLDVSGMVWMCGHLRVETRRSLESKVPIVWEGLERIREISSRRNLSTFITESGDLIASGSFNGAGYFDLHRYELPPIKQAANNWTGLVAVDHDGGLWRGGIDIFGCELSIPRGTLQKYTVEDVFHISSVAVGLDHLVMQKSDGQVCTSGGNKFGQLGIRHCKSVNRGKLNYLPDVSVCGQSSAKSARNT